MLHQYKMKAQNQTNLYRIALVNHQISQIEWNIIRNKRHDVTKIDYTKWRFILLKNTYENIVIYWFVNFWSKEGFL